MSLVNGRINGANINAVETLKIALSIALAKTGSFSIEIIIPVTLIYCRKRRIQIIQEITLKRT
jgi:hypothetical protein